MRIKGFNRVEIIVREDEIEQAVRQFNDAFGLDLPQPHAIQGVPVLSATDFDGHLEVVAPVDGQGSFGAKLERGPGQIGPLVWEIEDIEEARTWLGEHGYRITYEYDSRQGNTAEQRSAVQQLILDPAQWFGFNVTLMKRHGAQLMTSEDVHERAGAALARLLVSSFGDPDAIAALLTEDAQWWITPTVGVLGSPSVGRQAILASMRQIFGELYATPQVQIHTCVGDEENGAVRFTLRAVARFAGDRPYENEYTVWVHRRGDLIDRVWEYLDVAWSTAQFEPQ